MLFDDILPKDDEIWKKEWQNMPEFIQEDQKALFSLLVNFENIQDLYDFAKLIGQPRITYRTKSTWWPEKDDAIAIDKRYDI